MAGFVDPAFKDLKVNVPNLQVWRISKCPEENFEAKSCKKQLYGEFFEAESFIVYSASHAKKPLSNYTKGSMRKMEIHIHFWLGSKLTEDERRRTILKAIELDDVLEGSTVLHQEIQNYESNRFLSYFKNGIIIRNGEMDGGFIQSWNDPMPKLYGLFERQATSFLIQQPSISWNFMNCNGISILQTRNTFFIWVGNEAKHKDKYLAVKLEEDLKHSLTKKAVVWVVDGEEKELNESDLKDFEECLKLGEKLLTAKAKVAIETQTKNRNIVKLYELIRKNDNTIVHIKDGPLVQADLKSTGIFILDHNLNGIWVWVGRRVVDEMRSRAINIGMAYLDKKVKSGGSEFTTVTRVVEGIEPNEFKLLFKNWTQILNNEGHNYFTRKIVRPVNATFTAARLEEKPFLAAETQLLDYGSGKMKVVRVNGSKLEALTPEEFGIFHSGFSYLVHYSYASDKKSESVLYYWLGARARENEESNPIWPSLKDIPDLNNAHVRVRIKQYKEMPHFHAIFQGKMIVLNRAPSVATGKEEHPLDKYPTLLLQVEGGDVLNTRSVEVEPRAASLNPFGVFLLRTPKLSYIWCGLRSKGDEREIAKNIARKWASDFKVLLENQETKDFWESLNGYEPYSGKEKVLHTPINVPPRIFKCDITENGFWATEVINYSPSDLRSHDKAILDAGTILFVWIGSDIDEEERNDSERLAEEYLASDPCDRDMDVPIVQVHQGHEPPIFTGFFSENCNNLPMAEKDTIRSKLLSDMKLKKRDEATSCATEPSEKIAVAKDKYSLHELNHKPTDELPPGVDPEHREAFLKDEDFIQVFKMSRASFDGLPLWKRKNLKMAAGLF